MTGMLVVMSFSLLPTLLTMVSAERRYQTTTNQDFFGRCLLTQRCPQDWFLVVLCLLTYNSEAFFLCGSSYSLQDLYYFKILVRRNELFMTSLTICMNFCAPATSRTRKQHVLQLIWKFDKEINAKLNNFLGGLD